MADHPAVFPKYLLELLEQMLPVDRYPTVLDPFAGVGKIHQLPNQTVGVEIEPEWAHMHPATLVANALALPFKDGAFSAIATSPVYGNRMSDHHNAKDGSERHTYTHKLGRKLHEDNSGAMQWGPQYRDFHECAWAEAIRVLEPGGRFVLNVKDHIRQHEKQHVSGWHVTCLINLGLALEDPIPVKAKGLKHGENHDVRTPVEWLFVFNKES